MIFDFSLGRFYGIDSIVEFLIVIVSFIISYSSYKIYKLINHTNYKLFSMAFLSMSISFIFKILSNLTILYRVRIEQSNSVIIAVSQLQYMQLINFISFIMYKAFNILGFLILFLILSRTYKKEKVILYVYLCILAILFSIYFNFVFYITIAFLLILLTLHFYDNYNEKKSANTLLVFIAFLMMLISHIIFIFSDFQNLFYLVGEILLLISFSNLLINQVKINKQDKSSKSTKEKVSSKK